jgi:rod shape-determining protein MreC
MNAGGWELSRGSGSIRAHLPFALCMSVAIVIVLLGKAEASVFDNARAKFTDLSEPVLSLVTSPIAIVQRWSTGLTEILSVYDQNIQLRQENDALRRWQDVALTLEQRMTRYEALLNVVSNPELPSITARVIGQSSQPFSKTLILSAGENQNVEKGQAVLDDRGLLGRVFVAGENTSWVLLLTDLNSHIPVIIRPSNRRAILSGTNTMSPSLRFDSLRIESGEVEIGPGDRVYSTGDGGILPPDLPIGMVMGDAGDWRAGLFADPDLSDIVQIVDYRAVLDPPDTDNELPVSLRPQEPNTITTASENATDNASENLFLGEVTPR